MKYISQALMSGPKGGKLRMREGDIYLLSSPNAPDETFKVRFLGSEGNEASVSFELSSRKSELIASTKKLRLIRKILIATGLFTSLASAQESK